MKNFDEMEQYLKRELSDHEKEEFEKRMEKDPEMQKNFALMKDLETYIEEREDELKMQMTVKELLDRRKKGKLPIYKKLYVSPWIRAASIILLVGILGTSVLIFNASKNQRIFNQYYATYEFSSVERSASHKEHNTDMTRAINAYSTGDYSTAIRFFEHIHTDKNGHIVPRFLQSICYIETGQYQDAIHLLEGLSNQKNSMYHETILWYLGLLYVKTDQLEPAKNTFSELTKSNNYFSDRASEILKRL